MDRRQLKTRKAIFDAFIYLLSKKDYNHITVQEIIDIADVGRATFYSHFETKDYLLKELCKELFEHINSTFEGDNQSNKHLFNCDGQEDVFLHILKHFKRNDNNLLILFSSENNELFLKYYKTYLSSLIDKHLDSFKIKHSNDLPRDFLINYITSTFVETVKWWVSNKMVQSPEVINQYIKDII